MPIRYFSFLSLALAAGAFATHTATAPSRTPCVRDTQGVRAHSSDDRRPRLLG